MRDLDDLLVRIGTLLDQPPLPPLAPPPSTWLLSTAPVLTGEWPSVLPSGRFGCNVEPMTVELHGSTPEARAAAAEALEDLARPRPRPPRPFPPAESEALRHRAEHDQPRPRSWFGRWRRG